MIPLTLSVRNFLSYGENNPPLDFRAFSIACLSGKNGHGKSALVDAMTWALWGKCRVKNKEEVIKRGATDAYVELEFESEGNRYRILRSISKKKSGSQSSLDLQMFDCESDTFKPLDQGAKAQSTIEKILKMDYNSFICSSFILQGMADEFTKRTPTERKDVLSKILELDEYETLTKRAREHAQISGLAVSSLENEGSLIDKEIAQKDMFTGKLSEVRAEEERVSASIAEFETIYGKLIGEYESVKAKLDTLTRLSSERAETVSLCGKLEEELIRITEAINKDREIVSRADEILEAFVEYESVRDKERIMNEKQLSKSNLEKEIVSIGRLVQDEKAKLEQKINTLKTRIEENQKIIIGTEETLCRQAEIESGYSKLARLKSAEKDFDLKRKDAESLDLRLRELNQKIRQKKIEIETRVNELSMKINELAARAALSDNLEKEIIALNRRIGECVKYERMVEELKKEAGGIGEESNALSARRSELEKRKNDEERKLAMLLTQVTDAHCPLCESPLQEEAKNALRVKLEKGVMTLEIEIRQIGKELSLLESKVRSLRGEIEKLESEIGLLPGLNKALGEKEQGLKESNASAAELYETRSRLDTLHKTLTNEEFREEFDKELKELESKRTVIGYEEREHEGLKREIETLGKYEGQYELLRKESARKREAESEIRNAEDEIGPLLGILEGECYADKWKEKLNELRARLEELSYDEHVHGELKKSLNRLGSSASEKETLERAKLSLNLRVNEEKKLRDRIGEEKQRLAKIENEIAGLKEIESTAKEIKEKTATVENRLSSLKKQKDELMMDISRSESAIQRIEMLAARKIELGEKIGTSRREVLIYQELVKAFGKNGLQALIIEHAVPEIEVEANRILNKLTEGSMALSLEMVKPTQRGGEKETLEIYIGDSSGTRSYETFSGGEAFRIDFALRVGISKFIANRSGAQLRTLVIDEGFGTQDKDGLNHFVQVINSVKDDFDKIIAITHVDELKERFPVRIEVTKEPGAGSSFEVVYT
ncbi:MAG: AAA family ATPase [Thermodesulfobacteriota bacterium]